MSVVASLMSVGALAAVPAMPPNPDAGTPMPDARTITMTEEEFDEFMRKRRPYQETVPFLKEETFIPALTESRGKNARPFLYVQLPDRRVAFRPRSVSIRLSRDDTRELIDALPHFPETRYVGVWVQYDHPIPASSRLAATPIPLWVLEGLRRLPHMAVLLFQGGTFDAEAMALIASYPNLRMINLGHCRVTPESFTELSSAKSLESFNVSSGLGPDCFITLARLPRFKEFTLLSDTDDFNVPIDDDTRRAIESLDGRLRTFYAREIGTVVHLSFVRALLQVKSLVFVEIESVRPGAALSDIEQLANLSALEGARVGWSFEMLTPDERAEATRVLNQVDKEAFARLLERQRREGRPLYGTVTVPPQQDSP